MIIFENATFQTSLSRFACLSAWVETGKLLEFEQNSHLNQSKSIFRLKIIIFSTSHMFLVLEIEYDDLGMFWAVRKNSRKRTNGLPKPEFGDLQ